MKSFSFRDRVEVTHELESGKFDLVIVGGGITGAGVARDAASRGMKVALIEGGDFASGTSSRSSKLIHGGIRYLENLEFHLVFEALSERQRLFEIAPHCVHPLKFLIPLYDDGRVGMFKMGLGMWLYDALSMFDAPELHERLNVKETLLKQPMLSSRGLLGSFTYSDAYMDDDRLVLETLRSAHSFGAQMVSYVRATDAAFENGKMRKLIVEDTISKRQFSIHGTHFVSTVGPWTDIFGEQVLRNWTHVLRPTKGIHLTFRKDRLKLNEAVVMATAKGNRIIFAIPRHEMIVIGTTDTEYTGNPADVRTEKSDVKYLFEIVDHYFPNAGLTREDVISSYAGVRPLVHDNAETESKTSREHKVWTDPRNVTFAAGGKYTTYRKMAEDIVQQCLTQFSIDDQVRFSRSRTLEPLNPLATKESIARTNLATHEMAQTFAFSREEMQRLVDRHGAEAESLLKLKSKNPTDEILQLEARFAIENAHCGTLSDFYFRRYPLYLSFPDHGLSKLDAISRTFSDALGWNEAQRAAQIEALKSQIHRELAWK